jgi:cysteine-S-conjugate beta-lyase
MSDSRRFDRRSFLKTAGLTTALGALGRGKAAAAEAMDAVSHRGLIYDFDEVVPRVGTDSSKWDGAIATFGNKIEVGMGVADMDFRAAPFITRALNKRMEHENWGYLRIPDSYYQAVADWNKRRYGLEIDPKTITFVTGVHPGLIAGMNAFVPPGSRVLLTTPAYNGFYGSLRFSRAIPEESPMKLVDGRYSIDWEDFEQRVGRCNVFILCNPHNPTGNVWSKEDLMRMGQICLDKRVIVFADEIWCDFVNKGSTYTPFASLPDKRIVDNSITFKAASKSFNLAAMKVAWYFSTNPNLLERIRSYTRADLNTLGMVATKAALTEGDEWFDQLLAYIDGSHDYMEQYIRANVPLVKYRKPQATFVAWLDVNDLVDRIGARGKADPPSQIAQQWFADHARIFLSPGHTFGLGGASHMRANIGLPRPLLKKALDNMAGALANV